MKLQHEFALGVPVDQAWTLLTDLERIAPCMPGVQLDSADGEVYAGRLRVKVGPITANYAGSASFVERDVEAWTVVWHAEGRETRGKGGAAATVTMDLEPAEAGTRVAVTTDLAISGRLAQFGRGVLAEVSNGLLAQFVRSLEQDVAGKRPAATAPTAPTAAAPAKAAPRADPVNLAELDWPDDETTTTPPSPAPEPPAELDVLRAVAGPIGKRALVAGAVAVTAVVLARRLRR